MLHDKTLVWLMSSVKSDSSWPKTACHPPCLRTIAGRWLPANNRKGKSHSWINKQLTDWHLQKREWNSCQKKSSRFRLCLNLNSEHLEMEGSNTYCKQGKKALETRKSYPRMYVSKQKLHMDTRAQISSPSGCSASWEMDKDLEGMP